MNFKFLPPKAPLRKPYRTRKRYFLVVVPVIGGGGTCAPPCCRAVLFGQVVEVSKRDRIGHWARSACLISVTPVLFSLTAIGGSIALSLTDVAVSHS